MKSMFIILFALHITIVKGITFEEMNELARKEIGESFIENVQSSFPCIFLPAIENMFSQVWTPQLCSESDFLKLRKEAYCPVIVLWNKFDSAYANPIWVRNELEMESNAETSHQEFIDVQKGLYRPFMPFDGHPKLAFLTRRIAGSNQSCQRYTVVANLTFQIEGFEVKKKNMSQSEIEDL